MNYRKVPALRSVGVGLGIAGVLGVLHWLGIGLPLLLALAVLVAFVAWVLPWLGVRWLDAAILFVRGVAWAPEQGRFHSFAGVALQVEDDGRHVWVDGDGLMRALRRQEPDEAVAARHAGYWRRDSTGRLMLRVDEVVRVLAAMPGRTDPRVQRLRRYFEREVLYPAEQRRARA
jgi:hypothetical protein